MLNLALPSFRRRPESSLNRRPKDTTSVLSATHNVFELDSGVRRNDERFEQALAGLE
jgi:hypothetical protein